MNFRKVHYFLAVAEHRNFRKAAEAVRVAQSALSKHVMEIETQLGVRLLDRLPTGVRLTRAGEIYAEEARRSLDLMERAGQRAQRAARGELGRLTIAMNDMSTRNQDIARLIVGFAQRFTEVQLEFASMISTDQLAALKYNKIDAGILIERPENDALDHLRLATDPFCIALPRNHPLAEQSVVTVDNLGAEPFVSVAMNTYWLPQTRLLARCRELGFTPRIVQEVSNDHMQISFIAVGMGVGFVNASSAQQLSPHVVLRPVQDLNVALELDLVWSRHNAQPSLLQFVDFMRSMI